MAESLKRDGRAVMYLRVASDHPQDAQSICYQRDACLRIADKHGLTVVREYADLGRSARLEQQVELQCLLADLAKHRDAAHVIIWDYARLARDMTQLDDLISLIRAHGAEIITLTGVEVAERFIRQQIAGAVMDEASTDVGRAHSLTDPREEEGRL